ncbi:MAG: lipopolysaccharide transport periplasmic protein LptA [Nitrospirae bacterium]|nr:lipopolysaccharide transport periplasmic protein LptA [Nitrospirota bacterium]
MFSIATSAEMPKDRVKGPITITSETLTADNKAHTALFERNVIAKTTDMTIHADKMLVFYKEDGGEVTKIEATGNVRLLRETRLITSQQAVYHADEEKVEFLGEPRAVDGENVVTGTKMIYYINEDRSQVENSKVFLKNKKDR